MTSIRVKPNSPAQKFNGVKIFSTTMVAQRQQLGETVTQWIDEQREFRLVDLVVTQSSDISHHCITISVFYHEPLEPAVPGRKANGVVR